VKKLSIICATLFFVCLSVGLASALCIQDQYGNQYDFTVDVPSGYLYGVMVSGQACDAPIWYLTGSYVKSGGVQYELTPANPLGDADGSCIATYKVKGTYPNGEWFYTGGPGGQAFTFQACIAADTADNASNDAGTGGTLK